MIRGVHTMFYSSEPKALRAFLRDKLGFSSYTDVGEGWLIFDLPEADMGCHPAGDAAPDGQPSGTHAISFYCDDVEQTVGELKSRGVEFVDGIEDQGFGLVTHFKMPGDILVQLYQPRYEKPSGA
jgi:catechol 2,3-dioxygenase-like lactoylglutathione lyase family enzyme